MGRTLSGNFKREKNVLHKVRNSKRGKTLWSNFEIETPTDDVCSFSEKDGFPEISEKKEKRSKEVENKDFFGLEPGVLASMFQMTLHKGDQNFEDAVAFNTLSFALAMKSPPELLPPKSMSENYQLFPDYVPPQIQKVNFVDDDNLSTAFPILEVPQKIIQQKTIGSTGRKRYPTQDDEMTEKFEEMIKIYQSSKAIRDLRIYSGTPMFYPDRT